MSAVLFPKFVKASMDKDIEQLVNLVRSHIEEASILDIDAQILLSKFGIGLIRSDIPYQASLVVNDTKASLQINIILKNKNYSPLEERFLILHLLGHFLIDVQIALLEENTETFAIVEHSSPIQRFYNLEKVDNEYTKDLFASELLLSKQYLKTLLDQNTSVDSISKLTGLDKRFVETKIRKDFSEFTKENFNSNINPNYQHILENKTNLDLNSNVNSSTTTTNSISSNSSDSVSCFSKSFAASSYNQKQNQINSFSHKQTTASSVTQNISSEFSLNPNTSKGLQMLRDLAKKTQVHS